MKIRGFVFDLDGTLVDSKINFDSMKDELEIARDADVLAHIEGLPHSLRSKALEIVLRHEREGALDSTPIEGAIEFVELVKSLGKPCAIFTRNARELALECLQSHGFDFDLIVAREDAPPKPKPDGLLKIAELFNSKPSEILFVGDYVYDLHPGLAAGTPTALYLTAPADFDTTGAHLIFSSYGDLAREIV